MALQRSVGNRAMTQAVLRRPSNGAQRVVQREANASMPAPAGPNQSVVPGRVISWPGGDVPIDARAQRDTMERIAGAKGTEAATSWSAGFFTMDDVRKGSLKIQQPEITDELLQQAITNMKQTDAEFFDDVKRYRFEFEGKATELTKELLENSRKNIEEELKHYGIRSTPGGTSQPSDSAGGVPAPLPTQYSMDNTAAGAGMQAAAKTLAAKRREVDTARKAFLEQDVKDHPSPADQQATNEKRLPEPEPPNPMGAALHTEWEAQEAAYRTLRQEHEPTYPFLAVYASQEDAADQLERFAAQKPEHMAETIAAEADRRLKNIETVSGAIGGRFNIWTQNNVIQITRQRLNATPWQTKAVEEQAKVVKEAEDDNKMMWTAIAIGLGLLAAVPTGGNSVLAGVTAVAATLGTAATMYQAVEHVKDYTLESAANATDFDKAKVISEEEPAFLWLALDLVSAGLEIHGALAAFKTLKTAIKAAQAEKTLLRLIEEVDDLAPAATRGDILAKTAVGIGPEAANETIEAIGNRFRNATHIRLEKLLDENMGRQWAEAYNRLQVTGRVRPFSEASIEAALGHVTAQDAKYTSLAEEYIVEHKVLKNDGLYDHVTGTIFIKPGREGEIATEVTHEMAHAGDKTAGAAGNFHDVFWREFEAYSAGQSFARRYDAAVPGRLGGNQWLVKATDYDIANHIQQGYNVPIPKEFQTRNAANILAGKPGDIADERALAAFRKIYKLK